jgi:SPX domain protein involved in polyphosphate accumulation
MVNFAKRFFYAVITEWRDQYIDYKSLYKQIKLVKAAVLELAQAYANIKVITGDDAGKEIQLEKMEAERKFWTMLDENVLRVETWYNKQIDHFTEQFHILTLQAIQLQLIDEYDPFTRGLSTRVERELDRLHLGLDIGLSTHTRKDEAKIPLYQENPLFPLSKKTSINDVIKRVRTTTTQRRMSMDRSPIDNYGIEDSGYIHDDDISSGDEDDSDVSLDESESAGVIPVGHSSPRRFT